MTTIQTKNIFQNFLFSQNTNNQKIAIFFEYKDELKNERKISKKEIFELKRYLFSGLFLFFDFFFVAYFFLPIFFVFFSFFKDQLKNERKISKKNFRMKMKHLSRFVFFLLYFFLRCLLFFLFFSFLLPENNLVKETFETYTEKSKWMKEIQCILDLYDIKIIELNKQLWKSIVIHKIKTHWRKILLEELKSQKQTQIVISTSNSPSCGKYHLWGSVYILDLDQEPVL